MRLPLLKTGTEKFKPHPRGYLGTLHTQGTLKVGRFRLRPLNTSKPLLHRRIRRGACGECLTVILDTRGDYTAEASRLECLRIRLQMAALFRGETSIGKGACSPYLTQYRSNGQVVPTLQKDRDLFRNTVTA